MKPEIPIDVDPATGIWTTDGMPMIYVPRHFFVNNHVAIETALGRDRYAAFLHDAGYQSAYTWCDKEAVRHQLSGASVFAHYLKRLSMRGWGRFHIAHVDSATGLAAVELHHSVFVLAQPNVAGKLCYMVEGWFAGAMDWVGQNTGHALRSRCIETQCASEGHEHCLFTVEPS